jgi:hypothetical protein
MKVLDGRWFEFFVLICYTAKADAVIGTTNDTSKYECGRRAMRWASVQSAQEYKANSQVIHSAAAFSALARLTDTDPR